MFCSTSFSALLGPKPEDTIHKNNVLNVLKCSSQTVILTLIQVNDHERFRLVQNRVPCDHDLTGPTDSLSFSFSFLCVITRYWRVKLSELLWTSAGHEELSWGSKGRTPPLITNCWCCTLQQNWTTSRPDSETTAVDSWWWCQRQHDGQSRETSLVNTVSGSERGLKWGRTDRPDPHFISGERKIKLIVHHPKTGAISSVSGPDLQVSSALFDEWTDESRLLSFDKRPSAQRFTRVWSELWQTFRKGRDLDLSGSTQRILSLVDERSV